MDLLVKGLESTVGAVRRPTLGLTVLELFQQFPKLIRRRWRKKTTANIEREDYAMEFIVL